MATLSTYHPSPTARALMAQARKREEGRRPRLDPAMAAQPCMRLAWNVLRWIGPAWADPIGRWPFPAGASDENELLAHVAAVVAEFHAADEAGKPLEAVSKSGHIAMRVQAVARGFKEAPAAWHIVMAEFYAAEQFGLVRDRGCQKGDGERFAMAQFAMSKLGVGRAMLIGASMDGNEIFTERLSLDGLASEAEASLEAVVAADKPPAKIGDALHATCRECGCVKTCHGDIVPTFSCRSCVWVQAVAGAAWTCGKHRKKLSADEQAAGCPDHLYIPETINGAQCIATDKEWVRYRKADGTEFENSRRQTGYTSAEMARVQFSVLGNPVIDRIKEAVGATITEVTPEPQQTEHEWWVKESCDKAADPSRRFK